MGQQELDVKSDAFLAQEEEKAAQRFLKDLIKKNEELDGVTLVEFLASQLRETGVEWSPAKQKIVQDYLQQHGGEPADKK